MRHRNLIQKEVAKAEPDGHGALRLVRRRIASKKRLGSAKFTNPQGDGTARDAIADGESKAGKKRDLGVEKAELRFDRLERMPIRVRSSQEMWPRP
jgi:hypothetical protein